jgi:glucose/arabinose dehydrogenase
MAGPNLLWAKAKMWRLACAAALVVGTAAIPAACGGGGGSNGGATPDSGAISATTALPANTATTLQVRPELSQTPFDTAKTLSVPPGFGIRLWARVAGARFMALAPNGDVLVSIPGSGTISLLRERSDGVPLSFTFAGGLESPHDMVFHQIDNVTYLYIAESNRVTRSVYVSGDTQTRNREVVIANLPDNGTPELRGVYAHSLKNIALAPDHKLYVSIASSCNACANDTTSDPVRGAIYQYNADGSGGRLFARGIRNAEGLDFIPGTDSLWAGINERDEIQYPFNNDFDKDGQNDFGKVIQQYVDDNPPDLFTRIRDGGNYGWPFCNPAPNPAMSNLDLVRDAELNPEGSALDCAGADRVSKGIHAHSTPLGLSFLHASKVPSAYRKGAVIGLHGCWNCSRLSDGYKVVYFPFDEAGNAGPEIDLVTGFVTDPDARVLWGRPVDAIADANGNILISDDFAGAIYQLHPL